MKLKILILLTITAISLPSAKSQIIENNLNLKDIEDAMDIMGLKVFKWDFGNIDSDYALEIYIEQIINDTIYESKVLNFKIKNNASGKNILKIITKKSDKKNESFLLKIIYPTMTYQSYFQFHKDYQTEHVWKTFEEGEVVYEKKCPILLYGSMWEDELPSGEKIQRFCWGSELKRDMSNEELKNIKNMYLISYKLTKE